MTHLWLASWPLLPPVLCRPLLHSTTSPSAVLLLEEILQGTLDGASKTSNRVNPPFHSPQSQQTSTLPWLCIQLRVKEQFNGDPG